MACHLVARWWNGSFGSLTRKDVYLEVDIDTNTIIVRWRGGQFFDRDGRFTTVHVDHARAAVDTLLDTSPAQWRLLCYDPLPP